MKGRFGAGNAVPVVAQKFPCMAESSNRSCRRWRKTRRPIRLLEPQRIRFVRYVSRGSGGGDESCLLILSTLVAEAPVTRCTKVVLSLVWANESPAFNDCSQRLQQDIDILDNPVQSQSDATGNKQVISVMEPIAPRY